MNKKTKRKRLNTMISFRAGEGDINRLEYLEKQLGLNPSELIRLSLHAYFDLINSKKGD